jgi:hypothetical protein
LEKQSYNAGANAATRSGNGMTNKSPFTTNSSVGSGSDSITSTAIQFDRVANAGIQKLLGRYTYTSGESTNGMFGSTATTIASLFQLYHDFTPTYQVVENEFK